jgi:hypothetical protein
MLAPICSESTNDRHSPEPFTRQNAVLADGLERLGQDYPGAQDLMIPLAVIVMVAPLEK